MVCRLVYVNVVTVWLDLAFFSSMSQEFLEILAGFPLIPGHFRHRMMIFAIALQQIAPVLQTGLHKGIRYWQSTSLLSQESA